MPNPLLNPAMADPNLRLLEESEMRYRRLFEAAQDGILILDYPGGEINDVNPFLINMLGYSKNDLLGKKLWEIGAVIDKEASVASFKELLKNGYIRYDDISLRKRNGSIINVEFVSNSYKVANERVIQCNIRDVSDKKEAEKKSAEYHHSISLSMHEMVNTLSVLIDQRDPYTAGHQSRVADLSVSIATELNLPMHTIEGIRMSALIHDVGKVAIPAEILTKPTKLTDFELATLKNHVQAGYDILKNIHFPWPVAQIVLQHHERLDGSGYPNGLKGDSICLEARIIAVADCMEAMSGNRPYRMALGLDAALHMLEDDHGKLFDTKVVQACLELFRKKNYKFAKAAR
jgi:PAS domain S-box-containing protein/putative nucleotidyltransferase with HDIG domain